MVEKTLDFPFNRKPYPFSKIQKINVKQIFTENLFLDNFEYIYEHYCFAFKTPGPLTPYYTLL